MSKVTSIAEDDPVVWTLLLSAVFIALLQHQLIIPSTPYFDELHYLPAARALLEGTGILNQEHPPLGKLVLATGIALIGDTPMGWRSFPNVAGVVTLYAGMRAVWYASYDRTATIAFGVLAITSFTLVVQSRIAMLDIFMAAFVAVACWQFAAAWAEPECGRRRLAACGVAIGLAIASKWNAAVLAPLPGLVFLIARAKAGRRRLLFSRRGAPVPGITLVEAALWLGVVPLAVYALTFLPLYLVAPQDMAGGLIAQHIHMLRLQGSVIEPHTYMSVWWQWMLNLRGIWYLYENIDGAQRGVLFIGNPVTMLLGLPALVWCAWQGLRGRVAEGSAALLYVLSLGMWIVAAKPVQFYYHYFLPGLFLLAALALVLSASWQRGHRWFGYLTFVTSFGMLAYFYPVLTAAPLSGPRAFERWAWLSGWV